MARGTLGGPPAVKNGAVGPSHGVGQLCLQLRTRIELSKVVQRIDHGEHGMFNRRSVAGAGQGGLVGGQGHLFIPQGVQQNGPALGKFPVHSEEQGLGEQQEVRPNGGTGIHPRDLSAFTFGLDELDFTGCSW